MLSRESLSVSTHLLTYSWSMVLADSELSLILLDVRLVISFSLSSTPPIMHCDRHPGPPVWELLQTKLADMLTVVRPMLSSAVGVGFLKIQIRNTIML